MRTRINMPRLGESLVEGTVGRWLKREGDFVAEYEPLLEVITDKIDSEIPSPAEGVLLRILVDEPAKRSPLARPWPKSARLVRTWTNPETVSQPRPIRYPGLKCRQRRARVDCRRW